MTSASPFDALMATLTAVMSPHGPPSPAGLNGFTPSDFSVHFFAQLAVILITCRIVGWLGTRFLAQPQVVGEMIAGVVLGPSLFGLVAPDLHRAIFPPEMKNVLFVGAQLGVGLYMFLVGTTLRTDHFRSKMKSALSISLAGIITPFVIAIAITPFLLDIPDLFSAAVTRANATLFMGACIALTAFPMLARIINDRGLADTSLGTLSLVAGAFDDAVSWCVLAIVLAAVGGGPGLAILAIGGSLLYAAFLAICGRRLFAPLGRQVEREDGMSGTVLSITLALFSMSAFFMDAIGIHAIFGGFILGAVMPRGLFAIELKRKLEPITIALLLPMFFTYSGLNTRLTTVDTPYLVLVALGILVAAILAKGVACYVAARLTGVDNRTALGIGALMNSRGLMELIIINIGLQAGIIEPALFAMLVIMAVITTMMATPLFEAVYGRKARANGEIGAIGT